MADLPALRTALTRIGFTNDAAVFITDAQGLGELAEFQILTDSEVENLCKVTRRPGGTIPNPNVANAGQPGEIPNPGIPVSLRAENNLKLMCYFLRHKERTSRAVTAADVTLANVRTLREHHDWEKNHKDVEAPEINAKDWPRTIDAIEEWLRGCLGVTKIPLAYVIRENVNVPAVDPVGGYPSLQDELIDRAPIQVAGGNNFTPTYLADRARVWELISELTRDQDCWSYVRPAQKTRDGRLAYLGLRGHYLGANNVDNMSARAEAKLRNTAYSGEKRRWNFEKYVKVHIDQHAILQGLVEHGYSGVDERSKVRHLLHGIKTTSLDVIKTRIMSDAVLRNDFDGCVNLFQDFIAQHQANNPKDVTIATVKARGSNGNKNDSGDTDMTVEDRYYSKKEYDALSNAKKRGLKRKRELRGHQAGTKDSKSKGKLDLSKRSIKALASALRDAETNTAETADGSDTDTSEDEIVPMKPAAKKAKSNRSNSALTRKK